MSVSAHNTTERVHGYTPSQWVFGRTPPWSGTLHEEGEDSVNIPRDGSEAFQKRMAQQVTARRVFEEETLRRKIQQAQRAKHRKDIVFIPGDLVFIWRMGVGKLKGTSKTGVNKGAWIGPGVVLGTESRQTGDRVIPCSVIWVVVNDRLWRCAPEQVRRSSERERAEHVLRQARPWTFEDISKNLILGQYRNVAEEPCPQEPDMDETNPENEGQALDEDEEMEPTAPEPEIQRHAPIKRRYEQNIGNGRRYPSKMKRDCLLYTSPSPRDS